MSDYKESDIQGKKWNRCYSISIVNTYGQPPFVSVYEESRIKFGDQSIGNPTEYFNIAYNPAEVIELYDPATGEKTGTSITQSDLYNMLYSVYMNEAVKRDLRNQQNSQV